MGSRFPRASAPAEDALLLNARKKKKNEIGGTPPRFSAFETGKLNASGVVRIEVVLCWIRRRR